MITENLLRIQRTIPQGVTLVAVSKFQPVEDILEAYQAGQRVFGESRPQEMAAKFKALPEDIQWHMIGHLQTNKVKMIAPFVSLIHSVDSIKLAEAIDAQAEKNERMIDVLLQLHIAREETKFGWDAGELEHFLQQNTLQELKHIRIRGLMGMATFTPDMHMVEGEFSSLRKSFDLIKQKYLPEMDTLSMGMSGDYLQAIAHGSTMVRIGSDIFGVRNY